MTSEPRTLVHLITSLGGGGTENFLSQILSGSPKGYSHHVFYLGNDGVNGDRIRRLGIPVKKVSSLFSFYRFLCRERPVVLHTCLYWAHQVGRIVGRLAKVQLIVSSHQSIDVWQKPWHGWIDRWTLPLCDIVDVNSSAAQHVLEARLRHAAERPRFVKVENGVDFSIFKPQDRTQARMALQIPPDAQIGGTLMRLHPEKGAEKIPSFARALLSGNPRLYLLIGGTGPLGDRLKAQTRDLGDRIRWLGWQDDTARFLSALDFFWLLSREESFPQALLEASAMGLPWVAPDVGGVHELRDAGACGILIPPQTMTLAAAAAQGLLKDLPAQSQRAREGIWKLKERFELATMIQAFYSILLKSKSPPVI